MSDSVTVTPSPTYFIGLMSGTSLDGVDGVLCALSDAGAPRVLAHHHHPFDARTRATALALNASGPDELHQSARLGIQLAHDYAAVCEALLTACGLPAAAITAIGAHGQTIRHQPQTTASLTGQPTVGYTVQVNNPALLAELTHIDVIADFRSRDIAAGGQGAPLVPAFHRAVFGSPSTDVAVLNIGGIANISLLGANGAILGCDTGPGNVLLDLWAQQHIGRPFDEGGDWGAQGRIHAGLLTHLLNDPFFQHQQAKAPQSTGRDLFNHQWLSERLVAFTDVPPVDVQATLAMLTAQSAASQLQLLQQEMTPSANVPSRLLVCGGGAYNQLLLVNLAHCLPGTLVQTTADFGLPVLQVEAAAFAWLAWCFTERRPANAVNATGAKGPRILGALYPK